MARIRHTLSVSEAELPRHCAREGDAMDYENAIVVDALAEVFGDDNSFIIH
jgi:hypothetical protein